MLLNTCIYIYIYNNYIKMYFITSNMKICCLVSLWQVEGMSITRCEEKCLLPHQIAKELPNLKLLTMTKTSSRVIKVCLQQQNQNKLKWLHLQECNMKKACQ
jgi:hypothetical protein